jgi:hypothetical protein
MRILLTLFVSLCLLRANSQQKQIQHLRLGYLFSYYPDSNRRSFKMQDYMLLDILVDSGSIFYSKEVEEKNKLLKL